MADGKIKVFRVDDADWWAGEDVESVKAAYLEETGLDAEEAFGGDEPWELTGETMDSTTFYDDLSDKEAGSRTFAEQLKQMVDAGCQFPCSFASTEY